MSNLLERIKAQGARDTKRTVSVPEWGEPGKPLVIHYTPPNLGHVSSSLKAAPDDPVRQNVDVFCQLARDAEGALLFNRIDGVALMESADPAILRRLMVEMGIIAVATAEEAEGN